MAQNLQNKIDNICSLYENINNSELKQQKIMQMKNDDKIKNEIE